MRTIMKHTGNLMTLCFALIAGKGFTQAEMKSSSPAPAASAPAIAWQSSFTADTLTKSDIKGFELRAEQKVKDFYSYLLIISDPKYDIKLRQDAKKQALDIFYTANCPINSKPISSFLDSCINLKQPLIWQVNNVAEDRHFEMSDETNDYNGSLIVMLSDGTKKTISIWLYKKEKQFGSRKESIWTVSICDILNN